METELLALGQKSAVIVMAYGTPKDLDDVLPYYTHIRRGSPPPPDLLQELTDRYAAIGGRSPLLEITEAQRLGIEARVGLPTYLGQKHAAPFIEDAVSKAISDGADRIVGVVLAPHYSSGSIGQYEAKARAAAQKLEWVGDIEIIKSWAVVPGYVSWLAAEVAKELEALRPEARPQAVVVFSAHSLPLRVIESGDPYADELAATAAAVAEEAGLGQWMVGWQSAGRTADPWIGPDILEIIKDLASEGVPAAIICPCGFVADHLEVLYDIDIEAKAAGDELGIEIRRTRAPNDDPDFLDVVAGVVQDALRRGE